MLKLLKSESGHRARGGRPLPSALPEQGQAILEAAEKKRCQSHAARSPQPHVPPRLYRIHAFISPGNGAGDYGLLRHPGECQRGRGEAARGVSSGRQARKQR